MSNPNEDFTLQCEGKFKSIDRSLHLMLERIKGLDERLRKIESAKREMEKLIEDIKTDIPMKNQVREPIEGRDKGYNSCNNNGGFSF